MRLAAQRHEHLGQMPYAARLGPRRFCGIFSCACDSWSSSGSYGRNWCSG